MRRRGSRHVSFGRALLALALAACLAGAASEAAWARPGLGGSVGSRGSRSYAPPPRTATTPYGAAPFAARPSAPFAAPRPGYGAGAMAMNRHPLASGFLGGLLGAGIAGILLGHGLFGGMHGGGSLLGLLLQLGLLFLVVRWAMRRFGGGGAGAGMAAGPARRVDFGMPAGGAPAGAGTPNVPIGPADYAAFEAILQEVQRAWTRGDVTALSRVATPEMVSTLQAQLRDLAQRGLRNATSDVRFEQGDLAESWREGPLTYATVGIRYSMIDVTTDAAGRLVDGALAERVSVREYWTFVRRDGGGWVLSAIQPA